MNIFGREITFSKKPVNTNIPPKGSVTLDQTKEIEKENPRKLGQFVGAVPSEDIRNRAYRTRTLESVASWFTSLQQSELTYWRWRLLRIYRDIILDTSLKSTMDYYNQQVLSIPYHLYKKNADGTRGEIAEEFDQRIQKTWFRNLETEWLNCEYFGPSVIQLNSIQTDGSMDWASVPRWFYQPESGLISWTPDNGSISVPNDTTEDAYNIRYDPEMSLWNWEYLTNQGPSNLGKLMELAPIILYKRVCTNAYIDYIEAFGTPQKIFSTTKQNPAERENIARQLQEMGAEVVMVKDPEEIFELLSPVSTDAVNIFKGFFEFANGEISKHILGHEQLQGNNDKKSGAYSNSKSGNEEFQKRLGNKVFELDCYMNDYIMPRWVTLGYIPEGLEFAHEAIANIGPNELNEYLKTVLPYFEVDPQNLEETFGIIITGPRAQPGQENNVDTVSTLNKKDEKDANNETDENED